MPAELINNPSKVPLIPREVLFGNPERVLPALSPEGKKLAYIAPHQGTLNVWVKTLGRDDDHPLTDDHNRGIRNFAWAQRGKLIVFLQDEDGDENWRLYAISAQGGPVCNLAPEAGVQVRLIALSRQRPNWVLIGINNRSPSLHDAYLVNLQTGERILEAVNDINATEWFADNELSVRIAQVPTPDGGFVYLHRPESKSPWQPFYTVGPDDALGTNPKRFTADNRSLYLISSRGVNASELRLIDLITGAERVLVSDPIYDVSDLFIHPLRPEVQAAAILKEKRCWQNLDPDIGDDFQRLAEACSGDFTVVDRDYADHTWLILFNQDKEPASYYIYHRPQGKLEFLFSARPQLAGRTLARMQPIAYQARDGLTINGYLTLPPGERETNLPCVLTVHGGPWKRDTWGYDPETQWLANRGYAVLQVNFRGSTGYGKAFTNAGDKEWGGRMQDDLTDGIRWLVAQGIADPLRVAIFGGSFGGFAALSGLTTTPDLYRCGVAQFGPSNLITFQNTIPPYWEPFRPIIYRRIGHPVEDREMLEARSPLNQVDQILAPLLLVQGANDPRIKREESRQIRDALTAAGKSVEYLEFPNEGHGFVRPENRLKFYAAAERFLAEHLGGRCEGEDLP
ncbi:MAG: S9 family peptidase [Calditrichota bacterium]